MLGCARIGAIHSVVFGGFSADSLARPHQRFRPASCSSRRTSRCAAAKAFRSRSSPTRRCRTHAEHRKRRRRQTQRRAVQHRRRPRCVVSRFDGEGFRGLSAGKDERRGFSVHPLHVSGSTGKPKGVVHSTAGYLLWTRAHAQIRFRHPRRRRLFLHRRHRLGHRPQLRRLRPALQRRHDADVRGRADLSRRRTLLENCREVQGEFLLHRAHGHPRAHPARR